MRAGPRRRRPGALLGVLVMLIGAGTYVAGSSLATAASGVVRGNVPVNAGALNRRDFSANNSPTAVENPTRQDNLVVVNRVDTPIFSCALHTSFDGGVTWSDGRLPFPGGEELPPRCFAPDAAFGAEGTLYVSFVTLAGNGNSPNAAWVVTSVDGGRRFSIPTRVAGPHAFQVRISADPHRRRRVYLSWLQAGELGTLAFAAPGNPAVAVRSDDGGRTWTAPVAVNPPARARVVAPSSAVGPDGRLYVLYLDVGDDRLDYHGGHQGQGGDPYPGRWSLVLARSTDGGTTWHETVVDSAIVPTERFIVFFPVSPSLVVDPGGGRVYAGFHDGRLGDADVWVWASDNRGASFGAPVRVNDTPRHDGGPQYLPKLAVAPKGRLDVVYYDRRSDRHAVLNAVSLQSSTDGGRSFGRHHVLSDVAFNSRVGFGSERGLPDLGSRLGLVSTRRAALAVWTDTRSGSQASGKQDLARAVVAFSTGSPRREPLRSAGIVLGLMGAVGMAWVLRPWSHPPRSGPNGATDGGQDVKADPEPIAKVGAQ